ncbi:unnamed protein product [Moneuplotes crassus]|uniref:Uncharacterized protein n=1 Tax=Euplotes crassus TaxID=5936 RepID=A0AAD1YA49_EUPCR|nr:unnamed protein product [Moneuplotes crassus]
MSSISLKEFESLHDKLLNCYSQVFPTNFEKVDQKTFCRSERQQLEEVFMHNKLTLNAFFESKKST